MQIKDLKLITYKAEYNGTVIEIKETETRVEIMYSLYMYHNNGSRFINGRLFETYTEAIAYGLHYLEYLETRWPLKIFNGAQNRMDDVAAMFDLELGEPFKVECLLDNGEHQCFTCVLTPAGLECENHSGYEILGKLLTGEAIVIEGEKDAD